ncbi:MAG: hypothetical protein QNJ22_06915 [Desulfosarcinaceae bacterium]|nr:hypothetical protein [Desulfosarcinaceae bacterium]
MITRWWATDGGWKSITATAQHRGLGGGDPRRLGSDQALRWWRNEMALTAAPILTVIDLAGGGARKTLFTYFSIGDRMHRPQ